MAVVVTVQGLDARENLVDGMESEQPGTYRQKPAETGLLCDNGTTRRQVADAPVAEPAAARGHVATLGDAELGLGSTNEALVAGGRLSHPLWVYQVPTIGTQGRQVPALFGVNGERRREPLLGEGGQGEELTPRMGLLAVENALVLDGAVATPVGDRGEGIVGGNTSGGPTLEHYRLRRSDPLQPAGGDLAIGIADGLANGNEVAVGGEAHVDALDRLPELGECRVEVEVRPQRDVFGQRLVGQQTRDVDQRVGTPRNLTQPLVRYTHRPLRPCQQQRRGLSHAELCHHSPEIGNVFRPRQGHTGRSQRRFLNRLDEMDVIP